MTNTPKLFFATGAICALVGMAWGIQMSANHDHTFSAAHGHLNLIGFVTMSIFGIYYALTPSACEGRMSFIHYIVTLVTVLTLTPGIVMAISDSGEILAKFGSVAALLSMGLFVFVVLRNGVGNSD